MSMRVLIAQATVETTKWLQDPAVRSNDSLFSRIQTIRNSLVHYSGDAKTRIAFCYSQLKEDKVVQVPETVRSLLSQILASQ